MKRDVFDVRLLCVFTVIRDGAALGGVQLATHLAHLVLMVPHPPPLIYGETWPVAGQAGSRLVADSSLPGTDTSRAFMDNFPPSLFFGGYGTCETSLSSCRLVWSSKCQEMGWRKGSRYLALFSSCPNRLKEFAVRSCCFTYMGIF